MITEIELNTKSTKNIVDKSLSDRSSCKIATETLVSLVCGYEPETEGNIDQIAAKSDLQQRDEAKRRFESFRSLNQTRREKFILNFNLVLILLISIGLYVFFSVPPQLHIFKNLNLDLNLKFNQTVWKIIVKPEIHLFV